MGTRIVLGALSIALAGGCDYDATGLGGATGDETTGGPDDTTGDHDVTTATATATATAGTTSATDPDALDGSSGSTTDDASTDTSTGEAPPAQPCAPAPGLVACYDFDGIGGGALVDHSGHGNDGTAKGVEVVPGPFGDAAAFDDHSELAVPDTDSLDIVGELTFEAWILAQALPEHRGGVLDKDGQYSLFLYDSNEYRCALASDLLFAGPIVLGEWTHVACVYDGSTLRAFVNGVEIGSTSTVGPLQIDNEEVMAIGDASPDFDAPFDGAIGGVRVWSRALDDAALCDAAGSACAR